MTALAQPLRESPPQPVGSRAGLTPRLSAAGPTIRSDPRWSSRALLHLSRASYVDHVERHFASESALRAVRFAIPSLANRPQFASPRALIRALRCDASTEPAMALLSGYAELAEQTLHEAHELGWTVEPSPRVRLAFATSGLLAVVHDGVLRTIFFPGLPLDGADRHGGGSEAHRERAWPPEERHFYRVFRPAVQLIRSLPDDAIAGAVSQYGALKRVMPRVASLRIEHWLSLRSSVSSGRRE